MEWRIIFVKQTVVYFFLGHNSSKIFLTEDTWTSTSDMITYDLAIFSQVKYYLIENVMFDSLYNLIMYYRNHPLKGNNFSMVLKEPVPQPQSHEGKE